MFCVCVCAYVCTCTWIGRVNMVCSRGLVVGWQLNNNKKVEETKGKDTQKQEKRQSYKRTAQLSECCS